MTDTELNAIEARVLAVLDEPEEPFRNDDEDGDEFEARCMEWEDAYEAYCRAKNGYGPQARADALALVAEVRRLQRQSREHICSVRDPRYDDRHYKD